MLPASSSLHLRRSIDQGTHGRIDSSCFWLLLLDVPFIVFTSVCICRSLFILDAVDTPHFKNRLQCGSVDDFLFQQQFGQLFQCRSARDEEISSSAMSFGQYLFYLFVDEPSSFLAVLFGTLSRHHQERGGHSSLST